MYIKKIHTALQRHKKGGYLVKKDRRSRHAKNDGNSLFYGVLRKTKGMFKQHATYTIEKACKMAKNQKKVQAKPKKMINCFKSKIRKMLIFRRIYDFLL